MAAQKKHGYFSALGCGHAVDARRTWRRSVERAGQQGLPCSTWPDRFAGDRSPDATPSVAEPMADRVPDPWCPTLMPDGSETLA